MKPNFAHKVFYRQGRTVFEVDTRKATFQGHAWRDLGSKYKQKFENLLFITHATDNPIIRYI